MRRLPLILIALILSALACGLFTPASNSDAQPAPNMETVSTPVMLTTIPTFTLQAPTFVAPPPPALSPEDGFTLTAESIINGYAVRAWENPKSDLSFDSVLMIEAANQPAIRVDMFSLLEYGTGIDVNGDGYPEVVVGTYSGGAHCCFGTQVFSLRPDTAKLILQKPESNASGYFHDLDYDGVSEFVTFDDSFAYEYCPYAAGVGVKVIMAYDAKQDWYVPSTPRFANQFAGDIATHEKRAQAAPGEFGEWDGTNICAILPLALDFLYLGQPDQAQAEFASRYSGSDTDTKWTEILQTVQGSPLYTP